MAARGIGRRAWLNCSATLSLENVEMYWGSIAVMNARGSDLEVEDVTEVREKIVKEFQ